MVRILASDGMDKSAVAALEAKGCVVDQQFYDPEALKDAVKQYDVLVVRSATKVRVPHIDAAKEAARFGIDADRAANYHADHTGTAVIYEAVSEAVCSVRAARPMSAAWKKRIDEDYQKRR